MLLSIKKIWRISITSVYVKNTENLSSIITLCDLSLMKLLNQPNKHRLLFVMVGDFFLEIIYFLFYSILIVLHKSIFLFRHKLYLEIYQSQLFYELNFYFVVFVFLTIKHNQKLHLINNTKLLHI
jgi:hypothetical protein